MHLCKLSTDHWLNLAYIRSFQIEHNPMLVAVIWASGERSIYRDEEAISLLDAWADVLTDWAKLHP